MKSLVLGILLFCFFFVNTALSQTGNLKGSIQATQPIKPLLVLANISSKPCQLVESALGTVSITKVLQDGKEIKPILIETSFDEPLDVYLSGKLKTLQPGEEVSIPLRVFTYESGYALESITWSKETGAYALMYPLKKEGKLDLELTYNIPIPVREGAPLCGTVYASTSGTIEDEPAETSSINNLYVIAFLLILLLLVFISGLLKRKNRRGAKIIILLMGLSQLLSPNPVQADYEVPSSAQAQFDACMAIFREHPDITGEVLDALDDVRVEIVPNDDHVNDTARYGERYFRIYWDSENTYPYSGDGATSDPCTRLFHEMYHALDYLNGTYSRDECDSTGIETKEVVATLAQNRLREAIGLPPRTTYGGDRLPSSVEACTEPPEVPPCPDGDCGESNGDPHMRTFDGLRYDFQAVGEFIIAYDKAGDFEIQARQEPWPGSRRVSVNTAVATRVGSDRVELRMENNQPTLLVNGKKQELKTTSLKSGGSITVHERGAITISWPDGSTATVNPIGSFGLHLVVDPAEERRGKLEGLLGNFDGDSKNDIKKRGDDNEIQPTFENLYPDFADSWRVDSKTSLFTYESGTNTDTFTDRKFPYKSISAKDVPNRGIAESLCRRMGVSDPEVLENCILDVALTGRPEFAKAAANGQIMTGVAGYGGKLFKVKIEKPGDTGQIEFDGIAGDKIFLDVAASSFPDQCGVLALEGPKGNTISSGCILGGRGMIDGTTLPDTGKYRIIVTPAGDRTGQMSMRLIPIKDQIGTIIPDGPEVSAKIDKPGVEAEFSFEANKGQYVFLDIPSESLPDQCGGFGFKNAAGQILTTGCIINGKGHVNTTLINETGTYKVYIDPGDRRTGQVKLRLITPTVFEKELSINGSSVTAKLDKPGSFATLSFAGQAGQKVFIEVTSASIPGQCGGFYLEGPTGNNLGSGCITNGKGDIDRSGVILPATGIYTITIDPADKNTGNVTVRVRT